MSAFFRLFSAVLLLMAALAPSARATTDPVAYYLADGTPDDQSPGQHTASLPGYPSIPAYTTGYKGQAFSLDGQQRHVDFGNWFASQSLTISFWMKDTATAGAPQVDGARLGGQRNFHTGEDYWHIIYSTTDGKYQVETSNGGAALPFTITPGAWHHVLLSREGKVLRLFVDGVVQGTSTGSINDNLNFAGDMRWACDANLQHFWKGALDEIRFYDRSLTDEEIATLAALQGDGDGTTTNNDFDAVRDFSVASPDGNNGWSYGYTEINGTGFIKYSLPIVESNRSYWRNYDLDCSILKNTTSGDITYNSGVKQPADVLAMFPPNDGRKDVLRWTALTSGTYDITGQFEDIDTTTSDYSIVVNGDQTQPLFSGVINDSTQFETTVIKPFTLQKIVSAGDTIDFRVGWGSNNNYSYDGTGLIAKITPATVIAKPKLEIKATAVVSSLPPQSAVVHYGEDITYTFKWKNTGDAKATGLHVAATIPTYTENKTDLQKQFSGPDQAHPEIPSELSFNQYGHYVPASSPMAKDAKIVWDVADLDPGYEQAVDLTVHISTKLRAVQQLGLPNDYSVYSDADPSLKITGFQSGATNLSIDLRGALRFTAIPDVTTVAPGGLINYTLKLENLSSVKTEAAAVVFQLPPFTRFVGLGLDKKGKVIKPDKKNQAVVAFPGNPDQVLIYFGELKGLKSVTATVTLQSQWVDPMDVANQKLGTLDYAAAFLKGSNTAAFQTAIKKGKAGDYVTFLTDPTHSTAFTVRDSGNVQVSFAGSAANKPSLTIVKTLLNRTRDTVNDGSGDNYNIVQAGDTLTYGLAIQNTGRSAAEEVFVQDAMPDRITYVDGSAKIKGVTDSVGMSKLAVQQDTSTNTTDGSTPAGQHLLFTGMHLEPHEGFFVTYRAKVSKSAVLNSILTTPSGIDPDTGLKLVCSAGSASSPHTFPGLYLSGDLTVTGDIKLGQPRVRSMVPRPEISNNPASTKAQLDALYSNNPDALPLQSTAQTPTFIPGVERYYVHYENLSTVAIKLVDLTVPLPPAAQFYRAKFVKLAANAVAGQDGTLPGVINTKVSASEQPSFDGTAVKVRFDKLDAGESGDLMVEVIVTPDTVVTQGAFLGSVTSAPITFGKSGLMASVPFPVTPVGHKAPSTSGDPAHPSDPVPSSVPYIPEVGVYKVQPRAVTANTNFDITFVIFNCGDARVDGPSYHFYQPQGTHYVQANTTSAYNGHFVVDGPAATPGTDLKGSWDYIPAHSAVAITYTLKAIGPVGGQIVDDNDKLLVPYVGSIHSTPFAMPIVAVGTSKELTSAHVYSVSGRPLQHFDVAGQDVSVIDLGGGNALAEGPQSVVAEGSAFLVTIGAGRRSVVGPSSSISIGSTTAGYLLANRSRGLLLQAYDATPAIVIVPAGCLEVASAGQAIAAAGDGLLADKKLVIQGGKLISQDGGGLIGQDGGSLISQDGGSLISQDGGGLISQDGGGIISHDAGGIISHDAGGIAASLSGTAGLVTLPNNGLVNSSAGNLTPNLGN